MMKATSVLGQLQTTTSLGVSAAAVYISAGWKPSPCRPTDRAETRDTTEPYDSLDTQSLLDLFVSVLMLS